MSMNKVSEKQYIKRTNRNLTTNPLRVGKEEYNSLQKLNNRRQLIDKVMFFALGAAAIYAFYSALMSLML